LPKPGVFDKFSDAFSNAASRIRKKSHPGKAYSKDFLFESYPIIDADFVEVDEDPLIEPGGLSKMNSEKIDQQTLENLKEYLKTRSNEEISAIFEDIRKTLKGRGFKEDSYGSEENEEAYSETMNRGNSERNLFRNFSETISAGKEKLIRFSKAAPSAAFSLASEGKETFIYSSKELNKKWNNLSPKDRKMISDILITVIEIGILKGTTRSRRAALAVLLSIYRRQTPGKKDLEDFIEGAQRILKRLR